MLGVLLRSAAAIASGHTAAMTGICVSAANAAHATPLLRIRVISLIDPVNHVWVNRTLNETRLTFRGFSSRRPASARPIPRVHRALGAKCVRKYGPWNAAPFAAGSMVKTVRLLYSSSGDQAGSDAKFRRSAPGCSL